MATRGHIVASLIGLQILCIIFYYIVKAYENYLETKEANDVEQNYHDIKF